MADLLKTNKTPLIKWDGSVNLSTILAIGGLLFVLIQQWVTLNAVDTQHARAISNISLAIERQTYLTQELKVIAESQKLQTSILQAEVNRLRDKIEK